MDTPIITTSQKSYLSIPQQHRKKSSSLSDVLENWKDQDEIKYMKSGPTDDEVSGHYYTDSQQPNGVLEGSRRFFAHLVDRHARALHKEGIEAVVRELKSVSSVPTHSELVEKDFRLRKMLGQPLSVGALKKSLEQINQEAPSTSASPSTRVSSKPLIKGFSFVAETKPAKRESVLGTLRRTFSLPRFYSRKNEYQVIYDNQSDKKNNRSPTHIVANINNQTAVLKSEDFKPVQPIAQGQKKNLSQSFSVEQSQKNPLRTNSQSSK